MPLGTRLHNAIASSTEVLLEDMGQVKLDKGV